MKPNEIEVHVLDLLVDGESSFAALFFGLRHTWGHANLAPDEVLAVLCDMEKRNVVQSSQMQRDGTFAAPTLDDIEKARRDYALSLANPTLSDVAVDEVGLWFQISDRGRTVWSKWSAAADETNEYWTLDDRVEEKVLEVRAVRRDVAEAALG